jgi:hypothetical protein
LQAEIHRQTKQQMRSDLITAIAFILPALIVNKINQSCYKLKCLP